MKYNIVDYKATEPVEIVSFRGFNSLTDIPVQEEGVARVVLEGLADVASLGEPVLAAVAKFKGVAADAEALWEAINPTPGAKAKAEKISDTATGGASKPEKISGSKRVNKSKGRLQSPPADGNTSSVAGESGEASKQEKTMKTKAKKATKKAAKAKIKGKAKGTKTGPRGEKTLKVKSLLERKSGCTRKDILDTTGWPAVSVQAMAKAAGLKLRKEKEKGKPTRYFGS